METTFSIDRITARRLWAVIPEPLERRPVLASVTADEVWEAPEVVASCRRRQHDRVPALACTCGIYAASMPITPPRSRVWAHGAVELWGSVIEGERGYRAERARLAGDLELVVGMGPGRPRCTTPGCRRDAAGIVEAAWSYLARCPDHGSAMGFRAFAAAVDASLTARYGVRARLGGVVATV